MKGFVVRFHSWNVLSGSERKPAILQITQSALFHSTEAHALINVVFIHHKLMHYLERLILLADSNANSHIGLCVNINFVINYALERTAQVKHGHVIKH